jgi:hypothetical protein
VQPAAVADASELELSQSGVALAQGSQQRAAAAFEDGRVLWVRPETGKFKHVHTYVIPAPLNGETTQQNAD